MVNSTDTLPSLETLALALLKPCTIASADSSEVISPENIPLNKDNYVPFYFIYIILTNPKYSYVYKDKNLHLITSFNMKRKLSIESTMKSLGVKSVSWTQISRDKSLFDKIDESKISDNVDIIFVGAGIGKVNIFNQLKNTQSLIIDAGYIFETWEDPSLVSERDYCETSD